MKKTLLSAFGLVLVAAFGFTSCDDIEPNNRYEELEQLNSNRVVLLEEFTGQRCTNCPEAHRAVALLKEQYGEQFISVSIHAGSFGLAEGASSSLVGLMQPEGNEYAQYWSVPSYPSGVVNRQNGAQSMDKWATLIRDAAAQETNLGIDLVASVKDGEIVIGANLKPSESIEGKLQLWIVESGIVAVQIDNGSMIKDYVHNHVYRASVNGIWGEDVKLTANVFTSVDRTIKVKDNWNLNNLSVVGFVYNDKNGVIQAAECPVVRN